MKRLLLVLSLALITFLAYTQTIPKSKGFLSDYEELFTPEQNLHLTNLLLDYEKQTSVEIAILTVPDFESDIADFAQKTATEWGIGKKGIDNGLLIILSKNKNVLRTQTGYGLEGYLPDGWLKHTGDSIKYKYINDSLYYEGMLMYLSQIKERIGDEGYSEDTNEELIKENEEQGILSWLWEHPLIFAIVFGIWLIMLIFPPTREIALWILYLAIASGGKSGGSSGKGFGGGKFGGGGSTS